MIQRKCYFCCSCYDNAISKEVLLSRDWAIHSRDSGLWEVRWECVSLRRGLRQRERCWWDGRKWSNPHHNLSGGPSNLPRYSSHDKLGVSRSRVFRENPERVGPCVWLACLNLGLKMKQEPWESMMLRIITLFYCRHLLRADNTSSS